MWKRAVSGTRSSEGSLFPVRRGGDPHSKKRKMRREPRTSGNDALVAPLPTTSSHAEASLGEPRQVGCSDRDPVSEAPAPRPAHVRRGRDPGARGQRRPGLSAAGAGPRRQAGQRPGARGPGRPGRHALPGTWPPPRPRFPQAHLRGPGGQNRWGGPGRGAGPAEKPRCPPVPPRARQAPASPGRGPGLRDGGAPSRKGPPPVRRARGWTPDRRCADRARVPRSDTSGRGSEAADTRRRAPPGRPLGPPPGPARPPLTWRRAGGAGARRLLAGTRSLRAQSRASRRPLPLHPRRKRPLRSEV